jgi:transposase InsO family protein
MSGSSSVDFTSEEFQQAVAAQVAEQLASLMPSSSQGSRKKKKIPAPADFNGDARKLETFKFSMENYLEYNEDTLADDDMAKIQTVVASLKDNALLWYRNWKKNCARDEVEMTFELFWRTFKLHFDDPELKIRTKRRFANRKIVQKKGQSIKDFEVYFVAQADLAELNEEDRIMHFEMGVLPYLQNAMVSKDLNRSRFGQFVNGVAEVESRVQLLSTNRSNDDPGEQMDRGKKRPKEGGNPTAKKPRIGSETRSVTEQDGEVVITLTETEEPSKRGNFVNKKLQKQRKENDQCIKCGQSGHFVKDCPNDWTVSKDDNPKKKQVSFNANKATNHQYLPIEPLLIIPIRVLTELGLVLCSALIDNGSSIDLIDTDWVNTLGINTFPTDIQLTSGVGNTSVGKISAITQEVELVLGSELNLRDAGIFGVISLVPEYQIILGRPWLNRLDPNIKWSTNTVSFDTGKVRNFSVRGIFFEQSSASKIRSITVATTMLASGSRNPTPSEVPEKYAEFADVFDQDLANHIPPHRPEYDAYIEFKEDAVLPKNRPIIPLNREKDIILKKWLDEELAKGYIRPSNSQVAAPIFFVAKGGGGWRPCIDYRDLNSATKRIHTPLPLLGELIDRLHGAKIFTKIDLAAAYNQLRIRKGDEWKTSFRCKYGQYESIVLGFGTTNAPSFFQRWMNSVFADLLDRCIVVYLDDILVFSKDPEKHDDNVREVLRRLKANGMFARLKKCVFDATEVEFLGFKVDAHGIHMCQNKVQAVEEWPEPKSVHDVMSFLGFVGFYRRFIQNYSKITRPLTDLTRKGTQFVFNTEVKDAFLRLKAAVKSAPILKHIDMDLPFRLETDASDFAIGAVLLQRPKDSNFAHPVGFMSKKLLPAESRYGVHDKELLAIVRALEFWRPWLLASPFTVEVHTDHANLKYFATKQILSARHHQWAHQLGEYNFTLYHRAGALNRVADLLSRRGDHAFEEGEKQSLNESTLLPPYAWANSIRVVPEHSQVEASEVSDNTSDSEGEVFESVDPPVEGNTIQVTDEDQKRLITKMRHDSIVGGHFGAAKTLALIRRDFSWKGMHAYVKEYVRTCDCKRNKTPRHKPFGKLVKIPFSTRPWSEISLDHIVKLPVSNGCDSLLVVCDRGLTKEAHFIGTNESISADETAKLLVKHVFRYHGLPDKIISDRGPQFTSKVWGHIFTILGIKLALSTSYHPQTDGQTERINSIWEQLVRNFVNYLQDDWEDYNHLLEMAYNNAVHSGLKCSPWFASKGYNPRIDFLVKPGLTSEPKDIGKWLSRIKSVQKTLHDLLETAQDDYKRFADRRRLETPFKVGEKVYLRRKNLNTKRPNKKLDHQLFGPFEILEQVGDEAWRLNLPESMKLIHPVFHSSMLEPFYENTIPNRIIPPPEPVEIDYEYEYEVDQIKDSRIFRKQLQYLVSWKGYGVDSDAWEPRKNLLHCAELLSEFHKNYPNKPNEKTRLNSTKSKGSRRKR